MQRHEWYQYFHLTLSKELSEFSKIPNELGSESQGGITAAAVTFTGRCFELVPHLLWHHRLGQSFLTHWALHWQTCSSPNSERIYPLSANGAAERVGFVPAAWSLTTWQLSRSKMQHMFSISIDKERWPLPPLPPPRFMFPAAGHSWSRSHRGFDFMQIDPFRRWCYWCTLLIRFHCAYVTSYVMTFGMQQLQIYRNIACWCQMETGQNVLLLVLQWMC